MSQSPAHRGERARPRRGRLLALVGLAVLLAGMVQVWRSYSARIRPGTPAGGGLPDRLLADAGFEYRVWVAHPHQNLAHALARMDAVEGVGTADAWLAALGEVAGLERGTLEPGSLPRFGPFALPPSTGLSVAWSDVGEVAVAARVRPVLSVVAKLAGTLAGNPWLRGGEVELAGRTVRVGWRGRDWLVASDAVWSRLAGELERAVPPPPALALVEHSRWIGPLPPGRLALSEDGRGNLELASWGSAGDVAPSQRARQTLLEGRTVLDDDEVELLLVGAPGDSTDGRSGSGRSALVLGGTAIRAGTIRLPSAAAARAAGTTERFELPVESLARGLGVDLAEIEADELILSSLEGGGLTLAQGILPDLRGLIGSGEPAWGLWLDPVPLLELASTLRAGFELLPLLGDREAERWRAVEAALLPLARHDSVSAVVLGDGQVLVVLAIEPGNR